MKCAECDKKHAMLVLEEQGRLEERTQKRRLLSALIEIREEAERDSHVAALARVIARCKRALEIGT